MELTSLDGVKELLQQEDSEDAGNPEDKLLKDLIKAASLAISQEARREFLKTDGAERAFVHQGGKVLGFSPFDLRELDSVTVVGEAESPLAADEFRLGPRSSEHGIYEWLWFARALGECELRIKGDWGFAAIPDDVDYYTRLTVVSWLRNGVFLHTADFGEPVPRMGGPLPKEVILGLEVGYGRVAVG